VLFRSVISKSSGGSPKKFQLPNTPPPPIPGLIEELQQVQKKGGPSSLSSSRSKDRVIIEEKVVEKKPAPAKPKPLPHTPGKKVLKEVELEEPVKEAKEEKKAVKQPNAAEVEKWIYSDAKDASGTLNADKFAALANLYMSAEEWVEVLHEMVSKLGPGDKDKIEAFWKFLTLQAERPYLREAFKNEIVKNKLEDLLNEVVQWNTAKYFPIGVALLTLINQELPKDTIQMTAAFPTFSDIVSNKTIGKRKWGAAVDLAAKEFKNLISHECWGMGVKDVYNYLEAKDKSHPSLEDNKFAKLSRFSVALTNNIVMTLLEKGPANFERTVSFYVDVATKAMEGEDYASAYAIYLALNKVENKIKELECAPKFAALKNVCDENKNFATMRAILGSIETNMLTPGQILSKDIFQIKDNMNVWEEKGGVNPNALEALYKQQTLLDAFPPLKPLNSNVIDLMRNDIPGDILDIITYTIVNPKNFNRDTSAAAKKIISQVGNLGVGKDNGPLLKIIEKELDMLLFLCEHWSPYGEEQKEFMQFNFSKCAYLIDYLMTAEKTKEKKGIEEIKGFIQPFLDDNFLSYKPKPKE
jgi:hypothetical protein